LLQLLLMLQVSWKPGFVERELEKKVLAARLSLL
jgi:hypothetical protein